MGWKDELNKDYVSVENSVNDYQTVFKSQKRRRIIRWIIRQMYTGLFVYLFRDSKYIGVILFFWILFAVTNLFIILFLGKIIHWKFQKMSSNFQQSVNSTPETVDIEDVEVIDVEDTSKNIKE